MPDTICAKFLEMTERQANKTALLYPKNGQWLEATWNNYLETVELVAGGLHQIGVRPGDRVAILSDTRVEWAYLDMAILGLGAITVPIYQSSTIEDIRFIISDSKARVLVTESPLQAARLKSTLASILSLETIVSLDHAKPNTINEDEETMSWDRLLELGVAQLTKTPRLYKESALKLELNDIATILYTSGTTGQPKGVILPHSAVLSEVSEVFPLLGVTPRDRSLSFLPYAHILGRIEIWGHVFIGYTMAFALGIDQLKEAFTAVKPTLIVGVPRIFEKIYYGILAQAGISPWKKRLFDWAISVGKQISKYKVEKQPVPIDIALKYKAAKRAVFDKLSERMGGELRFAVSGGAPLSPQIAEFFHAAGLLILEGYGLTETTAAITVNTPFDYRFGTVGKAVGDVKLKIADDGEILVKSKKVMREYLGHEAENHAAFADGWFYTGDIGELSQEGYLRITDRKKDLIKTAGGKYVAPQRLENLLKASPYISQVHIHGDQRKYVVALITLNSEPISTYAEKHDISYKDVEALTQHPKVRELIRQVVAEANSQLASFESIKNFAVLPSDFTIENGDLTPSLKIKRRVVEERYREAIDRLYGFAD